MHYLAQNALLAELCGGSFPRRALQIVMSPFPIFYMQQTNFEAVHHHHHYHHHHIALMEQ